MRVAVVTPYFKESLDLLSQCHQSVRQQTYPCTHFLVADGEMNPATQSWSVEHIGLPRSHADNGNTPRCVGSLVAMNQGFDAIAYLDADNWYYPDHIAAMVKLHQQSGAAVCTATRDFVRLDGSFMYTDRHSSDGVRHNDTSCLFLSRLAYEVLPVWAMMPKELSAVCDQVVWASMLARGLRSAHYSVATVAFRTKYKIHYDNLGELPPVGTKSNQDSTEHSYRWWDDLTENVREHWASVLQIAPKSIAARKH